MPSQLNSIPLALTVIPTTSLGAPAILALYPSYATSNPTYANETIDQEYKKRSIGERYLI